MKCYRGTAHQIVLQEKVDALADWTRSTPGACQTGRLIGTDNPDRLGWETVFGHLEEDGVFGMRMIPAADVTAIEARLEARGCRFDTWNVFQAEAPAIRSALAQLDLTLPPGFVPLDRSLRQEASTIGRVQDFLVENGIAPFSGAMLAGLHGRSALTVILTPGGDIAATAYAYFPHNRHSPHSACAWGGLVAVAPSHRGRRLGLIVNAMMLLEAVDDLGAASVHELVSTSNEASRRMVRRCGLVHHPELVCGVATRGSGRFTT